MTLTTAQLDRAAGVLLAQGCGHALGVPYEFARPPGPGVRAEMRGGGLGPYAPGEWSDDTQLALCIARVAATGTALTSDDGLDAVAQAFLDWQAGGATDIGNQTRQVLNGTRTQPGGRVAQRMLTVSRQLHERTGRTAGNGALMRTGVVGLTRLDDADATAEAARRVAGLTHFDPLAGDSCVIWSLAIRHAVLHGTFDGVHESLRWISEERRDQWADWLDAAETGPPGQFSPNGFTVSALQAAWSAMVATAVPPDDPTAGSFPCLHLQDALHAAVRVGDDTDTVAAIAGALLGARWGSSAVPAAWRRVVHGWPGLRSRDLVRLGVLTARQGQPDTAGWPSGAHVDYSGWGDLDALAVHPADPDVLLGGRRAVVRPAGRRRRRGLVVPARARRGPRARSPAGRPRRGLAGRRHGSCGEPEPRLRRRRRGPRRAAASERGTPGAPSLRPRAVKDSSRRRPLRGAVGAFRMSGPHRSRSPGVDGCQPPRLGSTSSRSEGEQVGEQPMGDSRDLYAPRWVTDDDMPAGLAHEILPGLFMGGTHDDDVVYLAGEPTWFTDDRPYDAVVTLFAWARPVSWEVEELRYGFGDGAIELVDLDRLLRLAAWAHERWQGGDRVLIRCQAGLNRSGLVTALVLMLAGRSAAEAILLIRERRAPVALCNNEFVRWLLDHGESALSAIRSSTAA